MKRLTKNAEKTRFYTLLILLLLSIALAAFINTGLSQTLTNQFS